jgi:DNA-binding IclR family transcriptional regulator
VSGEMARIDATSAATTGLSQMDGPVAPSRSMADRIFAVLGACADSVRPLTLAELVDATGLPKPTLHRTCHKLEALGALQRHGHGFQIGPKLFALGRMSPQLRRVRMHSLPFMHDLVEQTGGSASLGVLGDSCVLCIEELYGKQAGWPPGGPGATLPLHATAIGKALVMDSVDEVLDTMAPGPYLPAYTTTTIVRPNLLREHLRAAKAIGAVVQREEYIRGTSAVGAPIVADGQTIAAVAVGGRFSEHELRHLTGVVRDVARQISGGVSGPAFH